MLLDEWHAGTYGIPDAKTIEAIRLCARLEGMLTDPVYEGKSMAALIDLVRDGRIEPGSRVLYAHLGGQPALERVRGRLLTRPLLELRLHDGPIVVDDGVPRGVSPLPSADEHVFSVDALEGSR